MAVDYFLKLDGIQGESQESNHKNEIQLLSFSWGASNVSSVAGTGGSGAGKVDLSDLSAMIYFDKSTPKFFKSICKGTHIPTGTLTATKAGAEKPYLKVDLKELFVTSLQISASSEIPSVSVSFTYNEIKIDYSTQDEKGNLTSTGPVTWNLKESKLT
ncbi:type VI secretion system tube protein Hcp [Edaphobacter sp.]|uniref:Hcp family type VI secretion system effector n=1 Tax=Edaphobacter sp. TaxID=1934404 RepID=UPI002DBDE1B9|nr:type VI secretion system tube protein Hcp [Edaphobacter sp.]HEU5341492.1 type VI secretion system tube protein Hcp [Edaphobacter sp.]